MVPIVASQPTHFRIEPAASLHAAVKREIQPRLGNQRRKRGKGGEKQTGREVRLGNEVSKALAERIRS